jgi:hypothetical protein
LNYVIAYTNFKNINYGFSFSKLDKLSGYVKYMDKSIETNPTKLRAICVKSTAQLDNAQKKITRIIFINCLCILHLLIQVRI